MMICSSELHAQCEKVRSGILQDYSIIHDLFRHHYIMILLSYFLLTTKELVELFLDERLMVLLYHEANLDSEAMIQQITHIGDSMSDISGGSTRRAISDGR